MTHLEKSYVIDETDQLDIDIAKFFDFCLETTMAVEEHIAGFHARLDKPSELSLSAKQKSHLLLQQAGFDATTPNIILGSASGCYNISKISNSL